MARTFVRSESDYLEVASAPALTTAFTVSGWYKPSSVANGTVLGIGSSASGNYLALGMAGDGTAFIETSGQHTAHPDALTPDAWNHIAAKFGDDTNQQYVFLNGVKSDSGTAGAISGLDVITVGGLVIAGDRVSFAGGDIGYGTLWPTALADEDIAALAAGANPMHVGAPAAHYIITGAAGPELDSTAGHRNLTVSGAAPASGGPPVLAGGLFLRQDGAWVAATRKTRTAGAWV